MSWQATAYFKSLKSVTAYEKILLFVLADYHNTHRRAAWPSVPLLAKESLMKERNCYDLLKALEQPRPGHPNGIIRRQRSKTGRGEITEYVFVDLDLKDANSAAIELVKGCAEGCARLQRNKEE